MKYCKQIQEPGALGPVPAFGRVELSEDGRLSFIVDGKSYGVSRNDIAAIFGSIVNRHAPEVSLALDGNAERHARVRRRVEDSIRKDGSQTAIRICAYLLGVKLD